MKQFAKLRGEGDVKARPIPPTAASFDPQRRPIIGFEPIASVRETAPAWVHASLFDQSSARLLVTPAGVVLWASDHAHEVIERSGSLRLEGARLVGSTRWSRTKLEALLAEASSKSGKLEDLFASTGEEEGPQLFVAAHRSSDPRDTTMVLVLREAERDSIPMPDFVRLFGLTQAETLVIGKLLNGMSVANIASSLNNSELTVRTHLKRSYAKMNIRTKEQLFAKLLRLMTD